MSDKTITPEYYASSRVSRRLSRHEMESPLFWALKHAILVDYLDLYRRWPAIVFTRPRESALRTLASRKADVSELVYDMSDWTYAYFDPDMFPCLTDRL